MKTTLKMILTLENGKTTTLSLAEPREDLTNAEVTEALDEIISKKAISAGGSPAAAIKRIYVQDVDDKALA
ncbi:hypothetical protein SELR_02650 [Selenomonas ruminantium subsp. lactilytica TAM6421]|uniref:DUF2922 domain-containing protein n=1 Tax=Selenomonas ruminantium subsp. lactilytica (strain NBRC 103574 / TAM6421) TaxID=927704 RepID=I0GMI6_SELRL|nr:DUF2922 domain-containing protein [Selenomonas ruminantium]BAL81973.1 hypothetical protein SELR_02650 [Selenomonas ruminantium subsp. lactilytica TAM6421]